VPAPQHVHAGDGEVTASDGDVDARSGVGRATVSGLAEALGAGLGALFGKVGEAGIDAEFQEQVRDMLKPGTSALFLVVEKVTPDKVV
jgi:zinc transporter ZupT